MQPLVAYVLTHPNFPRIIEQILSDLKVVSLSQKLVPYSLYAEIVPPLGGNSKGRFPVSANFHLSTGILAVVYRFRWNRRLRRPPWAEATGLRNGAG